MEIDKLIVQQSLSDHQRQNLIFSYWVLCVGKIGDDPSAAWKNRI